MEMWLQQQTPNECKLGISAVALQVTYPDARNWQIVLQRYNNLLITVSLILGEL